MALAAALSVLAQVQHGGGLKRLPSVTVVRRRSRQGTTAVAGGLVLLGVLAGCSAQEPAAAPPAADAAAGDAAIPVPTLSRHEVDGTGPFAPGTDDGSGPCDTAFIADMAGTFSGAPSAGDALTAWLDGPAFDHPPGNLGVLPGAPVDGWVDAGGKSEAERRFTSGNWEALTRQSSSGEWLVTQAGCSPSVGEEQPVSD